VKNIGIHFREINWVKKSDIIESLSEHDTSLNVVPLDSGLEAEVMKICSPESDFVLKIWNKESKPDVEIQYEILDVLYNQGVAVSKPLGWGLDENNDQVLLTSYDGTPINKLDKPKLYKLMKILSGIHKFPLEILGGSTIPKHDFISYFYPRLDEHPDIRNLLVQLHQSANMKQDCLIHGDYNLGNILESDGKFTVIDWTNVQLGDPRYDIAWSIVLIWIYVSEKYCSIYRTAFLTENNYVADELELFEAIASLRWILLNRIANLPKRNNTISRIKTILNKNKYLNEKLL